MKLYFTQDVKPDLCKSTGANTQSLEKTEWEWDKQSFGGVGIKFRMVHWICPENEIATQYREGRLECFSNCLPPPGNMNSDGASSEWCWRRLCLQLLEHSRSRSVLMFCHLKPIPVLTGLAHFPSSRLPPPPFPLPPLSTHHICGTRYSVPSCPHHSSQFYSSQHQLEVLESNSVLTLTRWS